MEGASLNKISYVTRNAFNLDFQITRTANLFHFISNLTNWHFSIRQAYKRDWLAETGPLTEKEDEILRRIKPLFKRYTFGPNFWGKVFLVKSESAAWKQAQKQFLPRELEILKQAVQIIEPRFQKIWEKEKILLKAWKEKLEKTREEGAPKGLIADLDALFNKEIKNKKLKIKTILLLTTNTSFPAGGASTSYGTITLEISRIPPANIRPAWGLIWHELIHNIWQDSKNYQKLLDKFVGELKSSGIKSPISKIPLKVLVNEAITESLMGKGYLAEKYFGFPSTQFTQESVVNFKKKQKKDIDLMSFWRAFSALKLLPLSKKYAEEKRPINQSYLAEIAALLQEFKGYSKGG